MKRTINVVNTAITLVSVFEQYKTLFETGNVCDKYDSSPYIFLLNLAHDLVITLTNADTVIDIDVELKILLIIINTNESSIKDVSLASIAKTNARI